MATEELPANEAAQADDDEFLMRRRRHKKPMADIGGLNLTAMMDVLTILLVFLIKQFSEQPEQMPMGDALKPPPSSSVAAVVPSVSLMVSKDVISVDQKPVMQVSNGAVVSADAKDPYKDLFAVLENKATTTKEFQSKLGQEWDGSLMVIADENTPYALLSDVLVQAGKAKFSTYRLIVKKM